MKTYLNSRQKEDFVRLAGAAVAAATIREEWGEHDSITAEEKKYLKMAASFTEKALTMIVKRLAPEEGVNLLRRSHGIKLVCMPKETEREFRARVQRETEESGIFVTQTALDAIIEMALCKGCSPCLAEEQETCPLRAAMLELDVPVYDSCPPEGVCPWEIRKEDI